MPDFINAIPTGDAYTPALELAPAAWTKAITFSVISATGQSQANPVLATWAKFPAKADGTPDFSGQPLYELFERLYVGNTIGAVANEWAGGVKFRSAVAGSPAVVAAERDFQNDIIVQAGNVTAATVTAGGATTPPNALVNVAHNDLLVASQPTVDIEDAGAFVWAIVNDAPNNRVKVTPPRLFTGRLSGAGAVLAGTGFTVSHPGPGQNVVTFITPFASAPLVLATVDDNTLPNWNILIANVSNTSFQVNTYQAGGLANSVAINFFAVPYV